MTVVRQSTLSDLARRFRTAWPAGHYRNIGMAAPNDLGDAVRALGSLLHPSSLVVGPAIGELESLFAAMHGEEYQAACFSAGRIGLSAILSAIKIRPGDEVIIPAYTCVAVPNPIIFSGAVPIYADIDASTLNLSWGTVSRVVSERTKAVVLQHTFGIPVDAKMIASECRARRIAVIEDCTHALGAKYHGRLVGTLGDASFFSTEQTKVISTGAGGLTLTANPTLAAAIADFQISCDWPNSPEVKKNLAYIARLGILEHPNLQSLHLAFHYYFDRTGWFAPPVTSEEEFRSVRPNIFERRMSNAVARIAVRQLKKLNANLSHRRKIAGIYERLLPEIGLPPAAFPAGSDPAYVRYPVRVPEKSALLSYARERNIHLGEWFSACVHPVGVDQAAAGYIAGTCPTAEAALLEVINLPIHPRMSTSDAHHVINVISSFLNECCK